MNFLKHLVLFAAMLAVVYAEAKIWPKIVKGMKKVNVKAPPVHLHLPPINIGASKRMGIVEYELPVEYNKVYYYYSVF
jgi:hypothetical protein